MSTAFLNQAGFGAARLDPLPSDASARRYTRLLGGPRPALLMEAPPPDVPSLTANTSSALATTGHKPARPMKPATALRRRVAPHHFPTDMFIPAKFALNIEHANI